MGEVSRPFFPISQSVNPARSTTEFSAKNASVTFFEVASSASAFTPFSQYSPIGERSSSGSGHAQLGQSKPPFWFMLNKARVPRNGIPSSIRSPKAANTPGMPAAQFLAGVYFKLSNFSGFSGLGTTFSFFICSDSKVGWDNDRAGLLQHCPNR
ncbi:hypothetical protein D3C87_1053470 [compost metagenome]